MDITVIGAGYAGLVTAAGLADFGHTVTNLDLDTAKIEMLKAGRSPIYETGLEDLLDKVMAAGRLRFTDSYDDLDEIGGVVFLVVGSPPKADGTVELQYLESAVGSITPLLVDGCTVVVKSTVPVGTARWVGDLIADTRPDLEFGLVSNPEFLRQGSAVREFLQPERLVIGADSDTATETMRRVYHALLQTGTTGVFTTLESAELIKYASNAFLAVKVSFINEMADLCEATGAVVGDVARAIGLDSRIAPGFLRPGPGFGGSCLPKDTDALLQTTRQHGVESRVLNAVLEVNRTRVATLVDRVEHAVGGSLDGRLVALLGLTFKADTDDLRESPAIAIAHELTRRGATIRAFDPEGMHRAKVELAGVVDLATDEYDAATGAVAAIIATEWKQFGSMSLERLRDAMEGSLLVDFRNMWDPSEVAAAGLHYISIGRPDA
jgi:UDPglucose 6-dehydrogenase